MMTNYNLTEEEWECVRVCVSNAPIPYDISQKKIPADILVKIGDPTPKAVSPPKPDVYVKACLI